MTGAERPVSSPEGRGGRGAWRWERVRPALEDLTRFLTAASIIGAGLRYYAEADDRTRDQLYREWDKVRSTTAPGRDGARDHALEDLARRNESLENLNLQEASMDGIDLRGALLNRSRMGLAQLQLADLGCRGKRCSRLVQVELPGAVLTGARLEGADMSRSVLEGAVLLRACLRGATLRRAHLSNAVLDSANLGEVDLREADLKDLSGTWRTIVDLVGANIYGVKNPPAGFVVWARDTMGAVDEPSDSAWRARRDQPARAPPSCPSPRG